MRGIPSLRVIGDFGVKMGITGIGVWVGICGVNVGIKNSRDRDKRGIEVYALSRNISLGIYLYFIHFITYLPIYLTVLYTNFHTTPFAPTTPINLYTLISYIIIFILHLFSTVLFLLSISTSLKSSKYLIKIVQFLLLCSILLAVGYPI